MEFLTSMAFVFGIGGCSNSTDYCPGAVGSAAAQLTLVEQDKHSVMFEAVHYSDPLEYDRGTEFYMLEYKYEIDLR